MLEGHSWPLPAAGGFGATFTSGSNGNNRCIVRLVHEPPAKTASVPLASTVMFHVKRTKDRYYLFHVKHVVQHPRTFHTTYRRLLPLGGNKLLFTTWTRHLN
jgi:hypothetical protein